MQGANNFADNSIDKVETSRGNVRERGRALER